MEYVTFSFNNIIISEYDIISIIVHSHSFMNLACDIDTAILRPSVRSFVRPGWDSPMFTKRLNLNVSSKFFYRPITLVLSELIAVTKFRRGH